MFLPEAASILESTGSIVGHIFVAIRFERSDVPAKKSANALCFLQCLKNLRTRMPHMSSKSCKSTIFPPWSPGPFLRFGSVRQLFTTFDKDKSNSLSISTKPHRWTDWMGTVFFWCFTTSFKRGGNMEVVCIFTKIFGNVYVYYI